MKKLLVCLSLAAWMGLAWAAPPSPLVLKVDNMTCPACSITIERALDKVPGVIGQRIDTEAGTVTVTFDADRTSAEAIATAITDAGFPARRDGGASDG